MPRPRRLLLGSDYVVLPLFAAHAEGVPELAAATRHAGRERSAGDRIVAPVGRAGPAAMQAVGTWWPTYHEWLHDAAARVGPVQLPIAPATGWIGGAFAGTVKADDVVSIMVHGSPGVRRVPLAGLLVDEWTELVPTPQRDDRHRDSRQSAERRRAAGAARSRWRRSRPGAGRWTRPGRDPHDTLDRARLRAVEPETSAPVLPGAAADRHGIQRPCAAWPTAKFSRTTAASSPRHFQERRLLFDIEAVRALMHVRAHVPARVIVGWNRLEGRPRTVEFDRALRAEVRDALWFLTRQWQFGEFKGEDAGSPVDVRTAVRVDPLQHYAVERGRRDRVRPGELPLETHVEREADPVRPDAARPGHAAYFWRLIAGDPEPATVTALSTCSAYPSATGRDRRRSSTTTRDTPCVRGRRARTLDAEALLQEIASEQHVRDRWTAFP